jgi:hypothetical protein
MSGERVCVTNLVPGMRPCTVRGEHRQHCDGHARRYDTRAGTTVTLDADCPGCLPRPAEVGYVCLSHLMKLDAALDCAADLVAFMLLDGSNGIRDTNSGGSAGGHESAWTLTESRVHASWVIAAFTNTTRVLDGDDDGLNLEFLDHRGGLTPGATAADLRFVVGHVQAERDTLIGTIRGAEAAVRLTDVVHRAYARFPLEETERRVVGVRCPQCGQARLTRRPPLMFRDDILVTCDACGHTEPPEWLEQYAGLMGLT